MFRGDERGQAVQIGAILFLAAVVISLSTAQAFVVPNENEKMEFRDFRQAVGDITTIKDAISSAATGSSRSVTVKTGSTYPPRTILINPPPASGRITTVDTGSAADSATGNITIANAEAVSSEANNTRQYWNGTPTNFTTKAVAFFPSYNEFRAPDMVVSGIAAYRVFDDEAISAETGQSLIQGNTITLVTIVGDLQAEGVTSSVAVEPVSATVRTVTVESAGNNINISLPIPATTNATAWNQSNIAASIRENPRVLNTTAVGPQRVNVSLKGTGSAPKTYNLKLARVEVRQKGEPSTIDNPPGRYIVTVYNNSSMAADQLQDVTVEVRDRYNNPVSGVDVTFELFPPSSSATNLTIDSNARFLPSSAVTGANGRASPAFDPFDGPPKNANERFVSGTASINSTFISATDTFDTSRTNVGVFNTSAT